MKEDKNKSLPARVGNLLSILTAVFGDFGPVGRPVSRQRTSEELAEMQAKSRRNWPAHHEFGTGGYVSRQQKRRSRFLAEFEAVRKKHGGGQRCFSYAEGMTRKAARRIARKKTIWQIPGTRTYQCGTGDPGTLHWSKDSAPPAQESQV